MKVRTDLHNTCDERVHVPVAIWGGGIKPVHTAGVPMAVLQRRLHDDTQQHDVTVSSHVYLGQI